NRVPSAGLAADDMPSGTVRLVPSAGPGTGSTQVAQVPQPPPPSPDSKPGSAFSAPPPPALGAAPTASTPSITLPTARPSAAGGGPGGPEVDSYDVRTHVWQANDSFEAISKKEYNSERYARAIVDFILNYPAAT